MSAIGRLFSLNSALTCPIVMSALRSKADAQSARVKIELMSAFPKADVQNIRIRVEPNVCLWPKADIRTESKSGFLNVRFGEKSGHSAVRPGPIRADFT